MKKWLGVASLLTLLVVVVVVRAADPTTKDIMTKAHKGPNSELFNIARELKEDEPKWDDIKKETADLVEMAKALAKNDPPKGDKESWQKLSKQYLDKATALDAAAKKMDVKATEAA